MPDTTVYRVEGMTCEHCSAAVTEEVARVAGVEAVDVELESGRVVVRGAADPVAVRAAVDEAGYSVVA